MQIFDKASWHSEGDFPADLPPERGATHIGIFLAWCAERGLLAQDDEDLTDFVDAFNARERTPAALAMQFFDGVVHVDRLSDTGAEFAEAYYDPERATLDAGGNEVSFFADYGDEFWDDGETIYHVADSWRSYERLAPRITERYEAWLAR